MSEDVDRLIASTLSVECQPSRRRSWLKRRREQREMRDTQELRHHALQYAVESQSDDMIETPEQVVNRAQEYLRFLEP